MEQVLNKTSNTVYCHFSFRRPRDGEFGIFAVAFYRDFEGKKCITHITRKFKLWKDHQFVTAIQSYEHALYTIYSYQSQMRQAGITNVMLVTDNSTLAGWIENPKKNKHYTEYMNAAVEKYRAGGLKEIKLSIGLCDVRDYEKSYKFCKEELICNNNDPIAVKDNGKHMIDLDANNIKYSTIADVIKQSPNTVEIEGIRS